MIISLAAVLALNFAIILGIASQTRYTNDLSIVATNFPAYDFVRAVVSDKAEVKMLIKPGSEIHDFEPTPSDIIDIEQSKLFIYTGGESDAWVEKILATIDTKQTRTLKMMDSVEVLSDDDGDYDEHVWTSLRNSMKIIDNIKNELIKIFPENQQLFETNARNYIEKLSNLDAEFQKVVKNGHHRLLIFGDRFPLRYFVADYGLDFLAAFPGCSEQTEASAETIALLTEKIKSEHIPVVLKIEMTSDNIAQTLSAETGAKILTFHSAHNISTDDFENGRTYAEIMEKNLAVLREALE